MSVVDTNVTVELGQEYRDTLTGFEGFATKRLESITGTVEIALERVVQQGEHIGEIKSYWFEEKRLESVA